MAPKLGLNGKVSFTQNLQTSHEILILTQTIFVTGGSAGLGLEISKAAAAQGLYFIDESATFLTSPGAHVTIFARRKHVLEEARSIIQDIRLSEGQDVNAVSVNLADASEVRNNIQYYSDSLH